MKRHLECSVEVPSSSPSYAPAALPSQTEHQPTQAISQQGLPPPPALAGLPALTVPGTVLAYIAYSTPYPPRKQAQPKVWPKWGCAFCGSNMTPERRAGPTGRNTLCNACGIKYHKTQKALRLRKEEERRSIQSRMSMSALLNGEDDDDVTVQQRTTA